MSSPDQNPNTPNRPTWRAVAVQQLLAARIPLLILGHLLVFTCVYWFAFLLRFDFALESQYLDIFRQTLPILLILKLSIFYLVGHFHGWWRHVTFSDLKALFHAATIATASIVAIDHFLLPTQIPRSIVLMDWGITILVIGALRAAVRFAREQTLWAKNGHQTIRSLIVGANYESCRLADMIRSHPEWHHQVVGLVGSTEEKKQRKMGGIPVVGRLKDIDKIAARRKATNVLLQAGQISGSALRELMDDCATAGLSLKIVADLKDQLAGSTKIPMRDIEINDLLRRDPVVLDKTSIAEMIAGKIVMVTGAGGSIGSELCRQIIAYRPQALILLGRGENRIYAIDLELRERNTETLIHTRIASVTDKIRMFEIFETYRPDIVFHAAAHKHVPLMEENVAEAIQNNVLGTMVMADLANEFGIERFVFISTDKAVNPTSVMGSTKQLGERYVIALANESTTRFMVTRFGNVLASNGSVVPLFKKQIQAGGPITVTDRRMTRFFMTIPEASQLVLQAAAIGEDGQVIVLDMGEQIRVIDMARDLIRLAGLPENAIEIVETGPRPGEKLYEELFDDAETSIPMAHPKLRAAQCQLCTLSEITDQIMTLVEAPAESNHALRHMLHQVCTALPTNESKTSLSAPSSIN